MKRIKRLVIALAMIVTGFATVHPEQARATTMVATVCTIAFNPCPPGDILDQGVRQNFVGTLLSNKYAVLPFTFVDGVSSVIGDVVVADVAAKYIYLVGFGAATSTVGPLNIDIAISQRYVTTAANWTFKGFNIGSCNGAATAAGDGVTSLPYVNGIGLGGPVSSPCSPFAQLFGPKVQGIGTRTNLTASAIFGFNVTGPAQAISLPWGDEFPDPMLTNLNIDANTTADSFESALKADGLTVQTMPTGIPEPATWAMLLLGLGCVGFMLRSAQRKQPLAIKVV